MGKQKVEIKLMMEDAKKKAKGLKTVAGLYGLISVQIDGDKIVVVGDGIDSVKLTVKLRKKMGFAELLSVSAVEEKKEGKKEEKKEDNKSVQPMIWQYAPPPQPFIVDDWYGHNYPYGIM